MLQDENSKWQDAVKELMLIVDDMSESEQQKIIRYAESLQTSQNPESSLSPQKRSL